MKVDSSFQEVPAFTALKLMTVPEDDIKVTDLQYLQSVCDRLKP